MSRAKTALHEAGHAVVMLVNGARLARVEIGLAVEGHDPEGSIAGRAMVELGGTTTARKEVTELLAGHAAVVVSRGLKGRYPSFAELMGHGATDDFCRAEGILAECIGTQSVQRQMMKSCWTIALQLVRWYWASVERLARELDAKGVMTGDEVLAVVDEEVRTLNESMQALEALDAAA